MSPDTTIVNPVVAGFAPDPSIIRIGEEYLLATSTFGWLPGIRLSTSPDLAEWTLVGHALETPPAFRGLKIEVSMPGPKYSAVLQATQGALHVSGGWAAAQMPEALHRGVHAFIPTAMDAIYVEVFRRFAAGEHAGARELHAALTPVLAFSNQHIDVSIRFFKHLRHREGLFATPLCRPGVAPLDAHQQRELEINLERVMVLQRRVQGASA